MYDKIENLKNENENLKSILNEQNSKIKSIKSKHLKYQQEQINKPIDKPFLSDFEATSNNDNDNGNDNDNELGDKESTNKNEFDDQVDQDILKRIAKSFIDVPDVNLSSELAADLVSAAILQNDNRDQIISELFNFDNKV